MSRLPFQVGVGNHGALPVAVIAVAVTAGARVMRPRLPPPSPPFRAAETNVDPALGCNTTNAVALQSMWQGPVPAVDPYGDDCGGEGGVPAFTRFRAPESPGSQGVLWYSFDAGSVHFVMFRCGRGVLLAVADARLRGGTSQPAPVRSLEG